MKHKLLTLLCLFLILQATFAQQKSRKSGYEEIDIEDLMHRYFGKDAGSFAKIEGIYSVSCLITKTTKAFITGNIKESVVERKDNYARVAILKDWPGTSRDFIEVSLSYHVANKYPIVGELTSLSSGGQTYIYKHFGSEGAVQNFSMASTLPDLIEGQYIEVRGRATLTYTLSYMKIYPKERPQEVVFGERQGE